MSNENKADGLVDLTTDGEDVVGGYGKKPPPNPAFDKAHKKKVLAEKSKAQEKLSKSEAKHKLLSKTSKAKPSKKLNKKKSKY